MWRDENVDVSALRRAVEANEVRGGSAIGCAVARVLALEAAGASVGPPGDLAARIGAAAAWAAETKPSMSTVHAAIDLALDALHHASAEGRDSQRAASEIASVLESFIQRSVAAVEALGAVGASLIGDGTTVVVHSFSESILSVLRVAAAQKTGLSIALTESRPLHESRFLAAALADFPVDLKLFTDAGMALAVAEGDLALVGADAVFQDGSFVNKTGTHLLALACAEFGAPLYVATELGKVVVSDEDERRVTMEMRPAGEVTGDWELAASGRVGVRNQFFEVTPARYVSSFVTEAGVIRPHDIRAQAAASTPSA